MAAKYRIAIAGYGVKKTPIFEEKLRLVTGLANLTACLNKTFDKTTDIIIMHGAGTALELWAGDATMHLGLGLEVYLPFPRITHIVKSGLNPIQAESLNCQLAYADTVKVTSSSYYYHGLLKRTKLLIDNCNLTAVWGSYEKTKNFCEYSLQRGKTPIDLLSYADKPINCIHTQGELC